VGFHASQSYKSDKKELFLIDLFGDLSTILLNSSKSSSDQPVCLHSYQ
jgi:hypothetical protein